MRHRGEGGAQGYESLVESKRLKQKYNPFPNWGNKMEHCTIGCFHTFGGRRRAQHASMKTLHLVRSEPFDEDCKTNLRRKETKECFDFFQETFWNVKVTFYLSFSYRAAPASRHTKARPHNGKINNLSISQQSVQRSNLEEGKHK